MQNRINIKSGLAKITIVFIVSLIVLNILWIGIYKFDRTPLYAINAMTISNMVIIITAAKKVKLTAEILFIMNLTLVFLGFVLIRGLLILR